MPFTDAQGRPELLMHPDLLRGDIAYRHEPATGDDSDTETADGGLAAPSAARPRATKTRSSESTSNG